MGLIRCELDFWREVKRQVREERPYISLWSPLQVTCFRLDLEKGTYSIEREESRLLHAATEPRKAGHMERIQQLGDHVIYIDEHSKRHHALVTNWWGSTCCNLLFVVDDENKRDPYGQQIERRSSSSHRSVVQAPGNFWFWPDEE